MSDVLFLGVENAVPADHPVAYLAIPIGMLFLSGSVFVLLWSNYGAKKAAGIYGVAFFGFSFLLGVFWWFGGPGIPTGLGISHLPGQSGDHYAERWYGFEQGSQRASFFGAVGGGEGYQTVVEYLGMEGASEEQVQDDPAFAALDGSVRQAVQTMQEQFLPVDENGVARIGVDRRAGYEEDAAEQEPEEADGRALPFFSAQAEGEPLLIDDPETGTRLATQQFQAYATFTDAEGIPLEPVPVGEPVQWYAFFDPGAAWLPSMLWTVIALFGFLGSLFWLDVLERREKRQAMDEVEEPEDLAVPLAQ